MPDASDPPTVNDSAASHTHSHPPRPPALSRTTGPAILAMSSTRLPTRLDAPMVLQPPNPMRRPGHSSSCTCSSCTGSTITHPAGPETGYTSMGDALDAFLLGPRTADSTVAHPAGPETGFTSMADILNQYPPGARTATSPPDYAYPPFEPFGRPSLLPAHRRERHRPDSTMSASSDTSTERSSNPYQLAAPTPQSHRDALQSHNLRARPGLSSHDNNPFMQAQALQHQIMRAQGTASRLGNNTETPANADSDRRTQNRARMPNLAAIARFREAVAQTQNQSPFPPTGNVIPTNDEMRAAQLRHHDAMLSDADHTRFGTGRRRPPPRAPAADQRPTNPRSRRHGSSVRTGATPSLAEHGNRHRQSPHLLTEDMLYVDEDDEEPYDILTPTLQRNSMRSSNEQPSHQPPLNLGLPDEATVLRRRRANAALLQQGETEGSSFNRDLYAALRRETESRGSDYIDELYSYMIGSRRRTALPANYVSTLPRVPVSGLPNNEHDRRCDICWEDYEYFVNGERVVREEPVRLTCGHILGHVCATEYFTVPHTGSKPSTICPTCRQEPVQHRSTPASMQEVVAPEGNIRSPRPTTSAEVTEHRTPQLSEGITATRPRPSARSRAMSQHLADYMAWIQQREAGNWTLAQHEAQAVQNARVAGPPPRGGPSFAEYEAWRRTEQARLEGWRLNSLGDVVGYADGRTGEEDEDDDDDEDDINASHTDSNGVVSG